MDYDFEIREICHQPNGLNEFWQTFSKFVPKLHEKDGELVITTFDTNEAIKTFLLLYVKLIPKNFVRRNVTPAIEKLIRSVQVASISI